MNPGPENLVTCLRELQAGFNLMNSSLTKIIELLTSRQQVVGEQQQAVEQQVNCQVKCSPLLQQVLTSQKEEQQKKGIITPNFLQSFWETFSRNNLYCTIKAQYNGTQRLFNNCTIECLSLNENIPSGLQVKWTGDHYRIAIEDIISIHFDDKEIKTLEDIRKIPFSHSILNSKKEQPADEPTREIFPSKLYTSTMPFQKSKPAPFKDPQEVMKYIKEIDNFTYHNTHTKYKITVFLCTLTQSVKENIAMTLPITYTHHFRKEENGTYSLRANNDNSLLVKNIMQIRGLATEWMEWISDISMWKHRCFIMYGVETLQNLLRLPVERCIYKPHTPTIVEFLQERWFSNPVSYGVDFGFMFYADFANIGYDIIEYEFQHTNIEERCLLMETLFSLIPHYCETMKDNTRLGTDVKRSLRIWFFHFVKLLEKHKLVLSPTFFNIFLDRMLRIVDTRWFFQCVLHWCNTEYVSLFYEGLRKKDPKQYPNMSRDNAAMLLRIVKGRENIRTYVKELIVEGNTFLLKMLYEDTNAEFIRNLDYIWLAYRMVNTYPKETKYEDTANYLVNIYGENEMEMLEACKEKHDKIYIVFERDYQKYTSVQNFISIAYKHCAEHGWLDSIRWLYNITVPIGTGTDINKTYKPCKKIGGDALAIAMRSGHTHIVEACIQEQKLVNDSEWVQENIVERKNDQTGWLEMFVEECKVEDVEHEFMMGKT